MAPRPEGHAPKEMAAGSVGNTVLRAAELPERLRNLLLRVVHSPSPSRCVDVRYRHAASTWQIVSAGQSPLFRPPGLAQTLC